MKIINFSVNNYKGINGGLDKNTINFENSNTIFILGQNNAGKSSFLQAYQVFYENDKMSEDCFFKKDTSQPIEMVLEVELTNEEIEEFADKKDNAIAKYFYGTDTNKLKLKKVWQEGKCTDFTASKADTSVFEQVAYAGVGAHNVFKAGLPKPIFIKAMPSEADLEVVINEILSSKVKEVLKDTELQEYKEAEEKIKALQKKVYDREDINKYKESVNEHFSSLFKGIKISISEKDADTVIKGIDKKFLINFDHINADGSVKENLPTSFENIGHGAIRIAIFTLFLMRDLSETVENNSKKFLVLFEEPELFLHPKLTKQLRKLIYEVSADDKPFQVLCASHSPQMIDITKPKTSLVRMVKREQDTRLFQVGETLLTDENNKTKQEIYEALRFNPFMCEAFFSDEVILVEGDTEAILLRAYLLTNEPEKDLFVVNCATVNNIPFFQKIFTHFNIKHHVICDTDNHATGGVDEKLNPIMNSHIQKSIYDAFVATYALTDYKAGILRVNHQNFEDAHRAIVNEDIKFNYTDADIKRDGKPYCANDYWNKKIEPNLALPVVNDIPIIRYIREIIAA